MYCFLLISSQILCFTHHSWGYVFTADHLMSCLFPSSPQASSSPYLLSPRSRCHVTVCVSSICRELHFFLICLSTSLIPVSLSKSCRSSVSHPFFASFLSINFSFIIDSAVYVHFGSEISISASLYGPMAQYWWLCMCKYIFSRKPM